jgi:hypothetical protein
MDTDLAVQMTMAQMGRTQSLAQILMLKKQHEMDMSLVMMLDSVARSAPPPGQGLVVDKAA